MEKGLFLGFFCRRCLQGKKAHVQRNAMQVFAGHVTSHRSQNESSKMRERGNKDGDKLMCNNDSATHLIYRFVEQASS